MFFFKCCHQALVLELFVSFVIHVGLHLGTIYFCIYACICRMFNNIRDYIFGASLDGYSGAESDILSNTLRTTAADDEWLLVDDGARKLYPCLASYLLP